MLQFRTKVIGYATAIFLTAFGVTNADNLVVNGDFETGDFTGWTQSGNTTATFVTTYPFYNFTTNFGGTYFAALGPVGVDGVLSQDLNTTIGDKYQLSYLLANDASQSNDFSVQVGGNTIFSQVNLPEFDFTQKTVTFTATVTTTNLTIGGFRNNAGFFGLDNVTVTDLSPATSSAVPLPKSVYPMMLMLGGLGLIQLRRKPAIGG